MKPLEGDCCVFCSYADVPCLSVQQARHASDPSARLHAPAVETEIDDLPTS